MNIPHPVHPNSYDVHYMSYLKIVIALLLILFNSYSDKYSWTGAKLRDTCGGKGTADIACLGY